jgi:hypothetical protein
MLLVYAIHIMLLQLIDYGDSDSSLSLSKYSRSATSSWWRASFRGNHHCHSHADTIDIANSKSRPVQNETSPWECMRTISLTSFPHGSLLSKEFSNKFFFDAWFHIPYTCIGQLPWSKSSRRCHLSRTCAFYIRFVVFPHSNVLPYTRLLKVFWCAHHPGYIVG